MTKNARALALEILIGVFHNNQFASIALDVAFKKNPLSQEDKNLVSVLVYGVLEKKLLLDYQVKEFARRESPSDKTMLLCDLGLYQLKYLTRMAEYASVDETVALAEHNAKGFVNACLRSFLRNNKEFVLPPKKNKTEHLSVKYSICPELVKEYLANFGEEKTEKLLQAFGIVPKLTLRVNTLKISVDDLQKKLEESGIKAEKSPLCKTALLLEKGNVTELVGFDNGEFFVEDVASQCAVLYAEAKKGDLVIDTCSCPGSKSFGMAIEMENTGKIHSYDLHKNKLSLVTKSAERLGISIIETEERDARNPDETLFGKADVVLCDVPCSGFGVLGKKPELRYKNPTVSENLPTIQQDILQASSQYVKEGGRLVYSTCTLLKKENEENVALFLEKNKDFALLNQKTFLPYIDNTDGFFVAVLKKS